MLRGKAGAIRRGRQCEVLLSMIKNLNSVLKTLGSHGMILRRGMMWSDVCLEGNAPAANLRVGWGPSGGWESS